jgi:hypothetical protein
LAVTYWYFVTLSQILVVRSHVDTPRIYVAWKRA